MQAIKKLKEHKIFGEDTIVESVVQKSLWGSPVPKKCFFRVKKIDKEYCICEADGKAHKIKYVNILTIDGQEPNELAAVYGLGPKTARFKRRKTE